MWTYRQPPFALQLLHELQKQQQGGLHCDTMLQTEGVSVPAHSCVLSALSPVFSRALANSHPLTVGHSRVLSVQAVGTRSLLKLVGFMYSGEMEGEGIVELEEVTDIAHRLGFSSLVHGLKELMKGQKDKAMKMREIGMQTENAEERKRDASVQIQSDRRSFMHSESQTDSPEAHFTDICTAPGSVGLSCELASVPSDENTSTSAPGVNCMKDTTAFSSVSEAAVLPNSKCCQPIQKENIDQLKTAHHRQKLNIEEVQSELNSSVLKSMKRVGGKDFRKLVKKLGFSSGTALEQQGDTHISLKIKLKRRRGALWDIVSVQEESVTDGSSASGMCQASPRKTRSCTKNGATCTKPQMNGRGVPLSPSPPNPRQALGTVTLTPPSDLTLSPPHTPVRNPPSSSLQIAPPLPGVSPAEESDEHIARLLEDMVMMGLNILPSGPMDRKSDLHHLNDKSASPKLQLDLKIGQGESFGTDAVPCLRVDGENLGAGGPDVVKIPPSSGCSAQGESGSACPGSENQIRCGTMDLKNMTSEASHPTSFVVTKDADATSMSSLPFSTGCLELQHNSPTRNVGELKNALDHLFWTANDYVQSVKQTKTNKTTEENLQSSGTATRSATHSDLARLNAVIQTNSGSVNSTAVKQQCEGASQRDSKGPPEDSSMFSSDVLHQQLFKQTSGSVHGSSSIADNAAADLSEMRLPRCLSPLASEEGVGQKHTKMGCTVRLKPVLEHLISSPQTEAPPDKTGPPPRIKTKTASVSGRSSRSLRSCKGYMKETNEGRLEQVITPSLTMSLKNPMLGEAKSRKLLRQTDVSGVMSRSTKRSSIDASLDEPNKRKRKVLDSNLSGVNTQTVEIMATCSTSEEAVDGIKSTKHSDNHCNKKAYWLRPGKTVKSDQTHQQHQSCKSKDQEECREDVGKKKSNVVKRGRGRPSKKEKHPLELQDNTSAHPDLQTTESKKLISEAISDLNLKKEQQKQPTRHASQTKRKCIVAQVFHQTIFTVESTVAGCLPSIDQKLQSRSVNAEIAQKTERKRGIGPPLPHIVKTFRKLIDQDHIRGRKLVISEKEVNDSTEKSKAEKMNNTGRMGMGQSKKNKNLECKNNSETVDVNANLDSDLPTVLLAGNFGSISSNNSETAKKCVIDTEKTSEQTEDIHLKKDVQSHQDKQVKGNVEIGALVKEIYEQNEEHEAEGSVVDVEVMEESALVAAGHGDEAATSSCYDGKTEIELGKSQSSVGMSNGESVPHEAELRGPLLIRTELQHISTDEDNTALMHTELPAIAAKKALSVQLKEKSYLNLDSSTVPVEHGWNIETEGQECDDHDDDDEEEEVVVDDLLSSPPVILANSLANQDSMAVLTDEDLESDEEEDVDVTG